MRAGEGSVGEKMGLKGEDGLDTLESVKSKKRVLDSPLMFSNGEKGYCR